MVRLTRIYTRGGDKGETSLGDGSRVPKHALRVAAYGTVDEANAAIGVARLHVDAGVEVDAMLGAIQNDLFDLGADLCTPEGGRRSVGALRISAAQIERLEHEIDAMNASLRPLELVHPAGRQRRGGLSASRPHHHPPRGAPRQRVGAHRGGQSRGAQIPEPPLRPPLRPRPPGQRQRRARRPLGPRRQPLARACSDEAVTWVLVCATSASTNKKSVLGRSFA